MGGEEPLPPRTQIVLLKMPQLQCEILHHRLSAEPDFDVVRAANGLDLSQAVERTRAEFVIVSAGRFETGEVTVLHETHPAVKVLAVSATGRQGLLYELRPHRVPLGDLSSDGLVNAIRTLRRPARARSSDQDHTTNGDGR
jgi:hypothetical protein